MRTKENCEKFYEVSKKVLDLFHKHISSGNDNFEYEKTKVIRETSKMNDEDKLAFFMTWQLLIDISFLGLNREKIENGIDIDWLGYVPENLTVYSHLQDGRPSKVPYFKEWLKVIDCKDKYLSEGADFWIKRVRNSFMHGNFVYDYDKIARQRIKVFEGNANSTDVEMDIHFLGLNEFIEDNFHNTPHDDYGITNERVDLLALNYKEITNRKELEDFLKHNIIIGRRKNKDGVYYNGQNIVDSETGSVLSRKEHAKKIKVEDGKVKLESHDFVDPNMEISVLNMKEIEMLIWVLENKLNIYKAPKQRNNIFEAIRQYVYPMLKINKLLHEFGNYCGAIVTDKKEYRKTGIDIKKMLSIINEEKENVENAFTILRLYRFLYRIQNRNFEEVDYSLFDCGKSFAISSNEEMESRINKNKTKMPDKEAENKAYIDTLRNALAHGNVEIKYMVDNQKLIPLFILTDDWTNAKTGERKVLSLMTTQKTLDAFLELADLYAFDMWDEDEEFKSLINGKEKERDSI